MWSCHGLVLSKSILPHLMFASRCFCDLWFVGWTVPSQPVISSCGWWLAFFMERSIDSAGLFIGVLGGANRRTDQESQHKSCLIEIFPTASSVARGDSWRWRRGTEICERVELETWPEHWFILLLPNDTGPLHLCWSIMDTRLDNQRFPRKRCSPGDVYQLMRIPWKK